MKIQCSRSELLTGVNTALRAVPSKTTMNILECILIEAHSGEIRMNATDMELAIETIIDGSIAEGGQVALNAKLLSEIVRKLPDNDVLIETDSSGQTKITCEKAVFQIPGQTGDDFPKLPEVEKTNMYTISQFSLKEIIRQTLFASADTEVNPVFSGELFEFDADRLRVIALDGQRIAIRNIQLKNDFGSSSVIVPRKTLMEISRILPGEMEKDVSMYITPLHLLLEFERTTVVTRLIEGEFFKVDRMLSPDYSTRVHMNKKDFQDCLDRASLMIRESDRRPVVMNVFDGYLNLDMKSQIGSMNEDLEAECEGKNLEIGFNPRFMLDVMHVIDDEQIQMFLTNSRSPITIRDEEGNYAYIVLPISLNAGGY